MRILFVLIVLVIFIVSHGYCQEGKDLIGQMPQIYTGGDLSNSGLIAGFSLWGLIAGILFGSIGFVAFMFGKKNSEFRPMLIGIFLMVYPYFLKNTIALYLLGVTLTVVLFVWRE